MPTLIELADTLRQAIADQGQTQARLAAAAGVSARTLTHVLSGQEDYRLRSLLAIADRLGLDVLLVPRAAVPAIAPEEASPPVVPSAVDEALAALRDPARRRTHRRKGP